jgi:hypothetical protein
MQVQSLQMPCALVRRKRIYKSNLMQQHSPNRTKVFLPIHHQSLKIDFSLRKDSREANLGSNSSGNGPSRQQNKLETEMDNLTFEIFLKKEKDFFSDDLNFFLK